MNWVTAIARSDIRALRAYEHASWEPGLIRLNANELPWRASSDSSLAGLNRYPQPHPYEFTALLARFYGIDASMVLACRGSDEAIDLLASHGKLVKRPFVLSEDTGLVGFKEDEWKKALRR